MDDLRELNQCWRALLTGKNHTVLSNFICQSFNGIVSFCEAQEIIVINRNNIIALNSVDIDDLSETCKLVSKRFEANFEFSNGKNFFGPLGSIIQKYLFIDTAKLRPRSQQNEIKLWSYRCLQLEIICKQIGFARNVNSHNNSELNDAGYAIMIAGSILRLQELFDADVSDLPQIEEINSLCSRILEVVTNERVSQKAFETEQSSELTTSSGASASGLRNEVKIQLNDNVNEQPNGALASQVIDQPSSLQDSDDEENFPIEPPPALPTREFKRQQLVALKTLLKSKLRSEFADIDRSDYLLTAQTIKELIYSNIVDLEDIWLTPSLGYLYKYKRDVIMRQLRLVEVELTEILVKHD